MSIGGIESLGSIGAVGGVGGFTPMTPPSVGGGAPRVGGSQGADFGEMVLDGLDRLDGVQRTADQLAVQAATGDLSNLHDYTIAATQAAVTTQVTVAVRNKAVEAFTEIMRMQV